MLGGPVGRGMLLQLTTSSLMHPVAAGSRTVLTHSTSRNCPEQSIYVTAKGQGKLKK